MIGNYKDLYVVRIYCITASDTPCNVAAMFTTNKVCAAPVNVCKEILSKTNNTGLQCVVRKLCVTLPQ